jgi:hypothetical protein
MDLKNLIFVVLPIILTACASKDQQKRAYTYEKSDINNKKRFKTIKDLSKDSTLSPEKIVYYDYLYEKTQ